MEWLQVKYAKQFHMTYDIILTEFVYEVSKLFILMCSDIIREYNRIR